MCFRVGVCVCVFFFVFFFCPVRCLIVVFNGSCFYHCGYLVGEERTDCFVFRLFVVFMRSVSICLFALSLGVIGRLSSVIFFLFLDVLYTTVDSRYL